ncbi:MAG TPA: YicC/YloC family endoribonuclease [Gemmatimonadales bacterium]|nr:YicC/YloC family endoribonuclease [Gemmatimonadales bacterium]
MPRSMTGFGVADGDLAGGRIQVEIRTVNHRHLNVQLRLPPTLQALEEPLRNLLRTRLDRGAVTVQARWIEEPPRATAVRVDIDRARDVVRALAELREVLDLPGEIDLAFVARQPEVLVTSVAETEAITDADAFLTVVSDALDAVQAMREREGEALARDLHERLATIATELEAVRARAPERVTAERDRLRAAVETLLDGKPMDEQRLAQEIALLADRLDVNEEMVRLRTHLDAAEAALAKSEPIGRTLGFLAQEMLREINTIGSKANDAEIAQRVIVMKGALEKFREQLENLE